MEKFKNKKNKSKTRKFRIGLIASSIILVFFWVGWLICDSLFLQSGITFYEGKLVANNEAFHQAARWMSFAYLLLSASLLAAEVSYIVYRSFAWKTDKNKVIYEGVIHGIIVLLILIFNSIASYRLFGNLWIAKVPVGGSMLNMELYYDRFALDMSIIAMAAFLSIVTLFQAEKPFKFHNLYFDFSLMVSILALVSIPMFIAAICLIIPHKTIEYPREFWIHITGQAIYNVFSIIKLFMIIFLIGKLILVVRINNGQLQRTKRAIAWAAVFMAVNVLIYLIDRAFIYTVDEIYANSNWIPHIIMISISFAGGIAAGWNAAYRYIELYAKPARKLEEEPMILN